MNRATSPLKNDDALYAALLERDSEYEGVAFVGVKTTGIFCRLTCTAKKPKRQNCEFFGDIRSAMTAGYRACLRCRPLTSSTVPTKLEQLVTAIDQEPARRWNTSDLAHYGIDASTARRLFVRRYGMTFVEFARTRRLGDAFHAVRQGSQIIDAQLDAGFESGSGFRDAFERVMGAPPKRATGALLRAKWLETPLGPMLALSDEHAVHLLEFADRRGLEREVQRLRHRLGARIAPGQTPALQQLETELRGYFSGDLAQFQTPVALGGSPFQQSVWRALQRIPPGQTRSYLEQAKSIGQPKAVRAVARANGANQLAIIIPCHRVIGADGSLTGYAGGLARKQWLLEHERRTTPRLAR